MIGGGSASAKITYPREMVFAGILAVVAQGPVTAADVVVRLKALGFDWEGSGPVFNCVQALSREGLLRPSPSGGRRASRVYELSPDGESALPGWVKSLDAIRWKLAMWCTEYTSLGGPPNCT